MTKVIQTLELEALPPFTNPTSQDPADTAVSFHDAAISMSCYLGNGDGDWKLLYSLHDHNTGFVIVHVPTGARMEIKLADEYALIAQVASDAEREGGYGYKVPFGSTEKLYKYLTEGQYPSPDDVQIRHTVARLEEKGAINVKASMYTPSTQGTAWTHDNWVKIVFQASDEVFDRIFDCGDFAGVEAI